ncbi:MAG: hypothetical protein ACR2JC_11840 [Chloroflexota bacterium]
MTDAGRAGRLPLDQAPLVGLVLDLAHSDHARLRDALIALLLRHPEDAGEVEEAARSLPDDEHPTSR